MKCIALKLGSLFLLGVGWLVFDIVGWSAGILRHNDVLVRLYKILDRVRIEEFEDVVLELSALEVIGLDLACHNFRISLADDGNKQVQHDDSDADGGEDVENLHNDGSVPFGPVHTVSTQSNQPSLNEEVGGCVATTAIGQHIESESKGTDDKQVDANEDLEINDDAGKHIYEEASAFENTQEIEDLYPHSEADKGLTESLDWSVPIVIRKDLE